MDAAATGAAVGGSTGTSTGAAPSGGSGGSSSTSAGGVSPGGVGESRQVAPPTHDYSATDTGADSDAAEASESGQPSEPIEAKPKYKIRRGGTEAEYEVDQLVQMLGDDYEHEIPGVGGKPMKVRWADMVRHSQMGDGYMTKMREAAEMRKQIAREYEAGKQDPVSFLESRLGIEDADRWAIERAGAAFKEEQRLFALREQNPSEFTREMEKRALAKLERRQSVEKRAKESAEREQQQAHARQAKINEVQGALKAQAVPVNELTTQLAGKILYEYAQAEHQLAPDQLAHLVRKQWDGMVRGFIGSLPDDQLLRYLGDDMRARLRSLEVGAARGAKKPAHVQQQAEPQRQQPAQQQSKGMSDADFKRRFGLT